MLISSIDAIFIINIINGDVADKKEYLLSL